MRLINWTSEGRRRTDTRDVDEAASLDIHSADASSERSYVNRARLYSTVSGERTSAIIQQAVFPRRKRIGLAQTSSLTWSSAVAEKPRDAPYWLKLSLRLNGHKIYINLLFTKKTGSIHTHTQKTQKTNLNKMCAVTILLANVNSSSCSLYVVVRPSVVCLSSVTFVRPTQAIHIFGNVSTPCGTLAISDLSIKILRRSSQGNPSSGGVKPKRGSKI